MRYRLGEQEHLNLDELNEVQLETERVISVDQVAQVLEKWAAGIGRSGRIEHPTRITAGAVLYGLLTLPKLHKAAQYMIEAHERPVKFGFSHRLRGRIRPLPFAEYGANLFMRGIWHELRMASGNSEWTKLMSDYDSATSAIHLLVNDPSMYPNFCRNIAERPIQTTIPSRALGPRLAFEAHSDTLSGPLTIVSIGHGLGSIEKKLLLNDPFSQVSVFDWYKNTQYLGGDREMETKLQLRLSKPLDINHIYAMDILPGDIDPHNAEWAISNLKLSEQADPAFMDEIYRLNQARPANYTSIQGDFARQKGFKRLTSEMNGEKADAVLFATVWHMLPDQDRRIMLENAPQLLKPGGIILVQDFVQKINYVEPVDDPLKQLYFPHDWVQWSYRLLEMDPQSGMEFNEELFFQDGRCRAVRISEKYKGLIF